MSGPLLGIRRPRPSIIAYSTQCKTPALKYVVEYTGKVCTVLPSTSLVHQCCIEAANFLDLNHDALASFKKKAGDLRSRDLDSRLPGVSPARRRRQEIKKVAARGAKSPPREVRPSPSILTPGASTRLRFA